MNQVIFNSICDIPDWIAAHPIAGSCKTSQARNRGKSWDGGLEYPEALAMAADGGYWEEGAAKMLDATSEMDKLKHDGVVTEIDYGVTGHTLDVDEYLTGNPECWERLDEDVQAPVISIGVQAYTPGGNSAEVYTNRGAALLSVIDDLEAKGIRVELWTCVSGKNRRKEGSGIDMRVCLKRAEESWSPSSIAFGLAHAAFARRLGFRVAESFKDLHRDRYFPNHAIKFHDDEPEGSNFDVWFGYQEMVSNMRSYNSPEEALTRVTTEVQQQLKEKGFENE